MYGIPATGRVNFKFVKRVCDFRDAFWEEVR